MAKRRELELHMLRFLPHPLRDDFVTVGLLLLESDGGFAELRFTSDLEVLRCIAPDIELDWFEMVENEIRGRLRNLRRREDLMQLVNERFGTMIDVAPTKAVQTDNPSREMEVLTSMYLVPRGRGGRVQPCKGRLAILDAIKEELAKAGLLKFIPRDLDVTKYTAPGDPFRFDFGYRTGGVAKMFHAVSVTSNVDQALALLYRYSHLATGMRQDGLETALTAVVEERSALADDRALFAIGRLKLHSVRVKPLEKTAEIADEVRRDAQAGGLSEIAIASVH